MLAVDTSVLLAVFKGESSGEDWLRCLQSAAEKTALCISSVVLAESRSFFSSHHDCREALRDLDIRHVPLDEDSALLAGQIFRRYRDAGGPRTVIMPDFLIAAHASCQADALATIDRGYLRRYFPDIRLVNPARPF